MDPVSIAAATVAFAEVTLKGVRLVAEVLSADQDVQSFQNELESSNIVLCAVKECIEARARILSGHPYGSMEQQVAGVTRLLQTTTKCYEEIQKILKDKVVVRDTVTHEITIQKRHWLYCKSRLQKMRTALRDHTQALTATVQAMRIADDYSLCLAASQVNLLSINGKQPDSHSDIDTKGEVHQSTFRSLTTKPLSQSDLLNLGTETNQNDSSLQVASLYPSLEGGSIRCGAACRCDCHQVRYPQSQTSRYLFGILTIKDSAVSRPSCSEPSCMQRSKARNLAATFYAPRWLWQRWIYMTLSLDPLVGIKLGLKVPRVIDFSSPAIECASYGDVEGLKRLFSKRVASPMDWCDLPSHFMTTGGRTLISQAIRMMDFHSETQQLEVVRFLIDAGADIQHELCQLEALEVLQTCRVESNETLYLLRRIVNSGDILDSNGITGIHRIILGLDGTTDSLQHELERPESLYELGRSESNSAFSTHFNSWSALDYAVQTGDLGLLKKLLAHGTRARLDPRRQPVFNWHHGKPAIRNQYQIIRELLEHGATADAALLMKIMQGASFETVNILIPNIADMNEQDANGDTVLHKAVRFHNLAGTRLLLAANVEHNIYNTRHESALHEAAASGFCEGVHLLLQHGATLESMDDTGKTPLHYAAQYSSLATLRLLIKSGANINAATFDTADTPLHYAAHSFGDMEYSFCFHKLDVIHALLSSGANSHTLNKEGDCAFDVITLNSDTEHVTGSVAAFLAHDVPFSCRQILLAIETSNFDSLNLLLARRDLYNMANFPDDQEKIFESAAKYANCAVLELLKTQPWTGCSAWFGTQSRATQYQDESYFHFTNWNEADCDCQTTFVSLQDKIRQVAFKAAQGDHKVLTEHGSEVCKSKFRDILTAFDDPSGIKTPARIRGYSVMDPIIEESRSLYCRDMFGSRKVSQPITSHKDMSDYEELGEAWLKCSCDLFIYQSDEGTWYRAMREEY